MGDIKSSDFNGGIDKGAVDGCANGEGFIE